jgi:hypothetical protein
MFGISSATKKAGFREGSLYKRKIIIKTIKNIYHESTIIKHPIFKRSKRNIVSRIYTYPQQNHQRRRCLEYPAQQKKQGSEKVLFIKEK